MHMIIVGMHLQHAMQLLYARIIRSFTAPHGYAILPADFATNIRLILVLFICGLQAWQYAKWVSGVYSYPIIKEVVSKENAGLRKNESALIVVWLKIY